MSVDGKAADELEAVVGDVLVDDEYAVAYAMGAKITFSLCVWQDAWPPQKSQVVLLGGIRKYAKGWRARTARPVLLSPSSDVGQ